MRTPFLKLAIFAAMMILCCSTMFVSTSVLAQLLAQLPCPSCPCPPPPIDDAQYNPTPIPWQGPADTCLIVDGCLVHICYAWRQTSANNYDYVVLKVCQPKFCYIPLDTLIWDASWAIFTLNPKGFPCDSTFCPGGVLHWEEAMGTCWHTDTTISGTDTTIDYTLCTTHGWCINAYWVCCSPTGGPPIFTYDRSVQTTWDCDADHSHYCTTIQCPPHHLE